MIDFNKLRALNPGKIIQLAIGDGHGPKADKISHAACAALKPRQAPMQRVTESQEYPFDHGSQCLPFDELAVHKRHEKFKNEKHGWISEEQFISLWTQKIPDFHTWYHGIAPSNHRFKVEISQLFYAYCYEKWFKENLGKDKENKQNPNKTHKVKILKALHELKQLPEPQQLAKEWLKAYFKRGKILAGLDPKNNYPGEDGSDSDYDTDSSQETDDEQKNSRIDRDIELAPLFPKLEDSKLSVLTWEDRSQSEDAIDSDTISAFLKTCIDALPELLPNDRELSPIVIEVKGQKINAQARM